MDAMEVKARLFNVAFSVCARGERNVKMSSTGFESSTDYYEKNSPTATLLNKGYLTRALPSYRVAWQSDRLMHRRSGGDPIWIELNRWRHA